MKNILKLGIFSLAFTSFHISNAQNNGLAYEIGVDYNAFKGKNSTNADRPNGGLSPYIGITYRLQSAQLPISVGLRANMFNLDLRHNNTIPLIPEGQFYYANKLKYVQIQMPIAYNFTFQKSEISAAINPAIYINTSSQYSSTLPTINNSEVLNHNTGISYILPPKVVANVGLLVSYTYNIAKVNKQTLGLKVHASYPLLNAISSYTTYDYDVAYKSGAKIGGSTVVSDHYAPLTFGVGLVLK